MEVEASEHLLANALVLFFLVIIDYAIIKPIATRMCKKSRDVPTTRWYGSSSSTFFFFETVHTLNTQVLCSCSGKFWCCVVILKEYVCNINRSAARFGCERSFRPQPLRHCDSMASHCNQQCSYLSHDWRISSQRRGLLSPSDVYPNIGISWAVL